MQALRKILQADHGRHGLAWGFSLALHGIVLVAAQLWVVPKGPQFGLFSATQASEPIPEPAVLELDLSPPAVLEPVLAAFPEVEPRSAPTPAQAPEAKARPEPPAKPSPSEPVAPEPNPPQPVEIAEVAPVLFPPEPVEHADASPAATSTPIATAKAAPASKVEIAMPEVTSDQSAFQTVEAPITKAPAPPPAPTELAMSPLSAPLTAKEIGPNQAYTEARYAYKPAPIYPASARRLQLEGSVVLDVRINADGTVRSAAIRAGSGHRILDQAALSGIRRWRFEPARRGSIPVPSSAIVPIEFRLD